MNLLLKLCAALAPILLAPLAAAQAYPDKPVRVIVPVPAGGSPDVVMRMLAPGISSLLGQQLVIDNRGGAGGLIGAELAARATPDGYTLVFCSPSFTILPLLQKKVAYDALKDFTPVGLVLIGPYLLVAHPSVGVRTLKDLLALAKAQPGRVNYASAGNGSPNHLATELLKSVAGVDIVHVPYKGAPRAVADLLGGHVNLMFSSIAMVGDHVKAGRLRLLAVSSAKRLPRLPEAPTISEAGVPGYDWATWFGLLAPAKTPKQIIARLNAHLVKVVREPEISSQLETLGYIPMGGSSDEFAVFIRREMEKNAKAVKLSGAKVD